jgi:hypothetical protein
MSVTSDVVTGLDRHGVIRITKLDLGELGYSDEKTFEDKVLSQIFKKIEKITDIDIDEIRVNMKDKIEYVWGIDLSSPSTIKPTATNNKENGTKGDSSSRKKTGIFKFTVDNDISYEAVIIAGKSFFLIYDSNKEESKLLDRFDQVTRTLVPPK